MTAVAGIFGYIVSSAYYTKFKKVLNEVTTMISDVECCFNAIDKAMEDDKITKEEIAEMWNKCKPLIDKIKEIIG